MGVRGAGGGEGSVPVVKPVFHLIHYTIYYTHFRQPEVIHWLPVFKKNPMETQNFLLTVSIPIHEINQSQTIFDVLHKHYFGYPNNMPISIIP